MVRLTDRPDMTLDVYRGRKTTMQQQQQQPLFIVSSTRQEKLGIKIRIPRLVILHLTHSQHETDHLVSH